MEANANETNATTKLEANRWEYLADRLAQLAVFQQASFVCLWDCEC